MCNISCELDAFSLLFVNFISFDIVYNSNRFGCYFTLLKYALRKNKLNTAYASDSIQQERLPVSLKVGRIYF